MDFTRLVEEKIKKSITDGDFENLEGKGEPLKLEDLSHVPEELRTSYKILKNSGYLPEEMMLKKNIAELEDLLSVCEGKEEKEQLEEKISEKLLRFNLLMEKRKLSHSRAFKRYQSKIHNRLF
ncbi:DUF1992 domain-containing protein [Priestia filamentosa]|uniref:DnaJ family domain-containing protein n=1 Tax=Priestia filamentosa TaxID=1402861 RepID=UPI001FB2FB50|nr:DUF1992 domain-containing protein [Priestia filamentosa]UOE59887.1 DUF1992 domain-containing protein [Priestia filamentosa]